MPPNQSAAANRRPAGQSGGSGNLAAIVAADRAFLALLGICQRTITARCSPKKRHFRLILPYPINPKSFGEQLRRRRLDEQLTQPELAAILGVSPSSIDKWERNKTAPPIRYHGAISGFLGFNPFSEARNPTAD